MSHSAAIPVVDTHTGRVLRVVGLKTTRGRVSLQASAGWPLAGHGGPHGCRCEDDRAGHGAPGTGFQRLDPCGRIGRFRLPAETWVDEAIDLALSESEIEVVEVTLSDWDDMTLAP